jgi:hypothetical protein
MNDKDYVLPKNLHLSNDFSNTRNNLIIKINLSIKS